MPFPELDGISMADVYQFISNKCSSAYTKAQVLRRRIDLSIAEILLPLFLVFIVSKVVKYRQDLRAVSHVPGLRVLFHPSRLPGVILPTMWWNPGHYFRWAWRDTLYKYYGSDTISIIPFGSSAGGPGFYSANLDVARQVAGGGHKSSFIKPEAASQSLQIWGMNLIAADKETWRKHRRVMGPAFNSKLYEMVWKETLNTYREMVTAEGWSDKTEIEIPVVQTLTFKLALLIIGKCGFGFAFNWFNPPKSDDGKISIQEALKIVSESNLNALLLPKWIKNLPIKRFQESKEAHDQLIAFMRTQVAERKGSHIRSNSSSRSEGGNDMFTALVRANEGEGSKFQLSDEELIGNVFILLIAGHETTAHTLAATLGFLGLYDDLQEEVYEQIINVIGPDRDPVFDDYTKLDKVLAVFYESIRMIPAGHIMIREAYEDTVLQIPNPHGREGVTTVPIPKGMRVVIDMIGVQYNPRYFDCPNEYRPSRWFGLSSELSETFSAFSIGPRACIGRRFAAAEGVCFLALLLRDFTVHPIMRPRETKEAWQKRVLDARLTMTMGVAEVPVKFVRRTRMG